VRLVSIGAELRELQVIALRKCESRVLPEIGNYQIPVIPGFSLARFLSGFL
jgi:hypothetical protein